MEGIRAVETEGNAPRNHAGAPLAWLRRQLSLRSAPGMWLLALVIGIAAGYASIGFFLGLSALEEVALPFLQPGRAGPWWLPFAAPVLGGLAVGLLLQHFVPQRRAFGIADLIEARAVDMDRIDTRSAVTSVGVSLLSLGCGASAGREGPIAHFGGAIGAALARRVDFPPDMARTALGCGAAAAVSASFNAPIAGVLFALEVVLRHYAPRAFGPIVIASAAGAIVARIHMGEFPAMAMPPAVLEAYWEYGAAALLGVISGLLASAFLRAATLAEMAAAKIDPPLWLRPALAGALIGTLALFVPEILGVGYGPTEAALAGQIALGGALLLLLGKILATAVTLAGRFGGGVFSPSLFIGAMAGTAFGLGVASLAQVPVSEPGVYAAIGMGAVAAAVLGAPISTALIAFELTRNYEVALALLIAVSLATVISQAISKQTFFRWQLSRRGVELGDGLHTTRLELIRVRDFMRPLGEGDAARLEGRPRLYTTDTLGRALTLMREGTVTEVPVAQRGEEDEVVGIASYVQALSVYNRALIDIHLEEHK